MAKLSVVTFLTLDGVMQAPGGVEEDTRGGFAHGGWQGQYFDEDFAAAMAPGIGSPGPLLFGRFTYEKMASFWPFQPDDDPIARSMRARDKFVVSSGLSEPLEWENAHVLAGEADEAVAMLKAAQEHDITILGSGTLVQSLLPAGLIDEFVLPIHPLVVGGGRRMFADDGIRIDLELLDAKPTAAGVIIARYRPLP